MSGLDPSTGNPGDTVLIAGQGFTGATTVGFGETSVPEMSVDADTQITVTAPEGAGIARLLSENEIDICEASSDVIGSPPLCTIDIDVVVRDFVPFASVCGEYAELAARLGFLKADVWQVEGA